MVHARGEDISILHLLSQNVIKLVRHSPPFHPKDIEKLNIVSCFTHLITHEFQSIPPGFHFNLIIF